jgi:broad specificity phosphatase PhoE
MEWNPQLRTVPHIERYWAAADPVFCDGDGAESFSTLLQSARAALERLIFHPTGSLAYVFSHGQFIQAVRSLVVDFTLSDREKMRKL